MRKPLQYILLFAALATVSLVLGDYFSGRPSGAVGLPSVLEELPSKVGAQSLSWRWTQTTGASTHIEVSAEEFAREADGRRTDLRGVVVRIFDEDGGSHDRVESAAMRMLEDGQLYSDGDTVFTLGVQEDGGAALVIAHATGVTFDPSTNSARTDGAVRYEFRDGEGSSLGAVYEAGSATLQMLADVRIDRFGPDRGRPATRILAGALRYAEEGSRIEVTGGARIEQGSLWLECDRGVVVLTEGVAREVECDSGEGGDDDPAQIARFAADRIESDFGPHGALQRVVGSGDGKLTATGTGSETEVTGHSVTLVYERTADGRDSVLSQVEVRGAARARMDAVEDGLRSTIAAPALRLTMRRGASGIERLETFQRGRLGQVAVGGAGLVRALEAGSIRLRYGVTGGVERLTAAEDVDLVERSDGADAVPLRTWSDRLDASFDPATGAVSGLRQLGGFRFEEGPRQGGADSASFDPDGGALALEGDAHLTGDGTSISAGRIMLDRVGGRLDASGQVSASIARSGEGEDLPAGLFAGNDPVFVAADAMTSDPDTGTVEYRGGARLWQGRNGIAADRIAIDRNALTLSAVHGVHATWEEIQPDGDGKLAAVSVRAGEMLYSEADGEALFQDSVDFRRTGLRVLSDQLRTRLAGAEGDGPDTALASGAVRIAEASGGSGFQGFGERAEFRLAESQVVLTGQPARIVTPDGGRTQGGELTFGIAGDRLLVAGQGAERPYTYRPPAP